MTEDKFDVLVIGGGVAGLTAAARLVKAGMKILVVERQPFLGGRFGAIQRDGFTLSTGGIVCPVGGSVEEAWRLVGAPFEVREPDPQFTYWIHGERLELPPKGALKQLVRLAAESPQEADAVWEAIKRGMAWGPPPAVENFDEWLCQFGAQQRLRQLFQAIIGAWLGINSFELPASSFFHYLREVGHMRGFGWPAGGNGELIASLVTALRERGVEIWTQAEVEGISVDSWRVQGASVAVGKAERRQVEAAFVISTVGPRPTAELVGTDRLESGYRKQVEALQPFAVVASFVASDRPLLEDPGVVVVAGAQRVVLIAQLTNLCPELAPEGQHLLESYAVPANSAEFDPAEDRAKALADLAALLPGFDAHARVLKVSIYRGRWPCGHAWPGHDLPIKTSVVNLYSTGDGHKPPGWSGIEAAAESSRVAVEDILMRTGRS